MIKMNMDNDNWNEIKKHHCEYVKDAIQKELSNLYITSDVYIKKRKLENKLDYTIYYELNGKERNEIEEFINGKFSVKGSRSVFTILNSNKLNHIITGDLDEIVSLFNRCSINKILIQRLFNYDKFCSNKGWNRHRFISMLGVTVCPYCNRQYITNFKSKDNGEKRTTADLDHFYSQNQYPYLALSLYNFIPSCQICNSRFKLKKNFRDIPHIYPYREEFSDNAKFKTKGDTIDYLLGNSTNFDIYIDVMESEYREKINNSIETFKLNDVYKTHTDYVQEIIKKNIIYSESKIEELLCDFPNLFVSKEELYRILFGNYITNEHLGKRPLSKLTKDICEELGINFEL